MTTFQARTRNSTSNSKNTPTPPSSANSKRPATRSTTKSRDTPLSEASVLNDTLNRTTEMSTGLGNNTMRHDDDELDTLESSFQFFTEGKTSPPPRGTKSFEVRRKPDSDEANESDGWTPANKRLALSLITVCRRCSPSFPPLSFLLSSLSLKHSMFRLALTPQKWIFQPRSYRLRQLKVCLPLLSCLFYLFFYFRGTSITNPTKVAITFTISQLYPNRALPSIQLQKNEGLREEKRITKT